MKAVGLSTKRERGVMSRHDKIGVRKILPEEGSGEVDRVKRPEFSRHRLRRSFEDDRIDFHELERPDQHEDRGAPCGHFGIGEVGAEAKTIQRPETLSHDEGARNAPVDLPPLRQCVDRKSVV